MKNLILSINDQTKRGKLLIDLIHDMEDKKSIEILSFFEYKTMIDEPEANDNTSRKLYPDFDRRRRVLSVMSEDDLLDLLNTKINEAGFSIRIVNGLRMENLFTIGDITDYSIKDLMGFNKLGKKSVVELSDFFKEHNILLD